MNLLLSKKMRYFIISVETKSINRAADLLCITRSPLGRVLSELEEYLGGQLFIRRYNQLEPTEMAYKLYEKLKPLYDLLCSIEDEFNTATADRSLELLLDISVPYFLYQNIQAKIRESNLLISSRRVSVTSDEIKTLSINPNAVLFTYRKIWPDENINVKELGSESMVAFLPDSISDEDIKNFDKMKDVTLYIKRNEFFGEMKNYWSELIKEYIPYFNIRETDNDISTILFLIGAGHGMLLLPEHLANYFNPPDVRKIKMEKIKIHGRLYSNRRLKNKFSYNSLIEILSKHR